MVNFFEQQAAARKRTALCVALYALAVTAVTVCVVPTMTLAAMCLTLAFEPKKNRVRVATEAFNEIWNDPVGSFSRWPNAGFLIVALGATLCLIFGASLMRYVSLRRGGAAVAEGIGARRVLPEATDADERRLLNVVEEMALASSVPVPAVYVMEREDGVNAFAAGHSPSDAVIAVTRGALRRLSREQLQGVVAHEFSHILNGDMRLNLRLMGLLYGIICVTLLGEILARVSSRSWLPIIGILLMAIGAVGAFFARLIKAMISRQREYLADASAVQFTRNPDGIAGALRVIGGVHSHGRLSPRVATEFSHMTFVSAASGWMDGFMATHPPLKKRIKRIDPRWDGSFLPGREPASGTADEGIEFAEPQRREHDRLTDLLRPVALAAAESATAIPAPSTRGTRGLTYAGTLSAEQVFERLDTARSSLTAIPARLAEPAREAFTARSLLLAMLLDADETVRQTQLNLIAQNLGAPTERNTRVIAGALARADRGVRLPLIDLSVGSLAALSAEQYHAFRSTVKGVINADDRVDLFELCLEQILIKHLDRKHVDARPVAVQYYALNRLGAEVGTLLWAVAASGNAQPTDAARNVGAALTDLGLSPTGPTTADGPRLDRIVAAMSVMRSVTPRLRAKVLTACAALVGADGKIDPQESELLRAIAHALDLPLAIPVAGPTGR